MIPTPGIFGEKYRKVFRNICGDYEFKWYKSISLKLQEQILKETEQILENLKTSRNKYINEAVKIYNMYRKRKLIEEQLSKKLKIVAEDSTNVLHKFESLPDEI